MLALRQRVGTAHLVGVVVQSSHVGTRKARDFPSRSANAAANVDNGRVVVEPDGDDSSIKNRGKQIQVALPQLGGQKVLVTRNGRSERLRL